MNYGGGGQDQGPTDIESPESDGGTDPVDTPSDDPTQEPEDNGPVDTPTVIPPVTLPPLPSTSVEPVDEVLTLAQATLQCTLDGISQLDITKFNQCVEDYMNPGKVAADKKSDTKAVNRPSDLPSTV